MTQSMFDKIHSGLDYWFGVMDVVREGPLRWRLTPNDAWPEENSFGFHFSRDCLSFSTPCKFRAIENGAAYRLTFPEPIDDPRAHSNVLEAALWARLTEV